MSEITDERRRFHRIATDKGVRLLHDGVPHQGTVLDISLRGLLLELDGDWRPQTGTRVEAGISLEGDTPGIVMDGEVAHVDGRRLGLRCVSIELESASRLRRMVELNLQDDRLLERELTELVSG